MTDCVEGGGFRTDTLHGLFKVICNLVDANKQNNVFRSESDTSYSVPDHVYVHELTLTGEGIGA